MTNLFLRDAVTRAQQFLNLAKKCSASERDQYEMFLEAAIVFGRSALHRLQSQARDDPNWKEWWDNLRKDEAVEFFRTERDYLLKEGPARVHQVIRVGKTMERASECYYFEKPETPATETVGRHLERIRAIVVEGRELFSI